LRRWCVHRHVLFAPLDMREAIESDSATRVSREQGGPPMKRSGITAVAILLVTVLISQPSLAAGPAGMRLYVFTSGSLGGFPKAALQIGGQGNIDWAPGGFYVIKHPKGTGMVG